MQLSDRIGLRPTTDSDCTLAAHSLPDDPDPYSQSGKAQLARELGVRMVTEQVFLHMLDEMQPVSA